MADDWSDLRMIAIDLLDEILVDELEHHYAQADALALFGEGHDPKTLARALLIAIADRLSGVRPPAETP